MLARDADGQPVDLVAWSAKERMLATWQGVAWAIGLDQTLEAFGLPARAYLDPLRWLVNDRDGLLILNPSRAALELHGALIEAEDDLQAAALRKALTLPAPVIRPAKMLRRAA